ncbi:hypothetical protein Deipr_2514 (plasmid) [Deinococcus proteolyticus MRP]|uniref:Uncharacterized protein n=1 Tax=Deinococcus proteolyticus (strain ATCC 35074 / DSM 20540 / JCM 6276 / NBRC 101906 / NCIMB 13154 / VKM Ac-1939 / CCM 2703 / MRP) TaxID=693977 RepID=F0RQS2_DEIPM|nr:hypothetical protein [Deinococcus proteolyticus]ADY27631.1 hypothetical protein Deipr_2514 [Deinococcus proteolyticus MRP]
MLDRLIHFVLLAMLLAYVWLFVMVSVHQPLLPVVAYELEYQLDLLLGGWTPVQRVLGGALLLSLGTVLLLRGAELRHAH